MKIEYLSKSVNSIVTYLHEKAYDVYINDLPNSF